MEKQMLQRQIQRYSNDTVRYKQKADRVYATYKAYKDNNDYLNSQRYYALAKCAEEICNNYKAQLQ